MLSQNHFVRNHNNQNCVTTTVCMLQYDFVPGCVTPCSAEINPPWKHFTYDLLQTVM